MQKDYSKNLGSSCKEIATRWKDIVDIVLYGSTARGKTDHRDLDLMIIFLDRPLKERIIVTAELKEKIKKEINNADIKSMNLKELFDQNFLSRQAVLIEGISQIDGKTIAQKLGFIGITLFSYTLSGLTHTQKIRFNYSMKGRGTKGLLETLGGKTVGKGAVKIPIQKSEEFEEFLKSWNIKYSKERSLQEKY